jgi:hypothetical protein
MVFVATQFFLLFGSVFYFATFLSLYKKSRKIENMGLLFLSLYFIFFVPTAMIYFFLTHLQIQAPNNFLHLIVILGNLFIMCGDISINITVDWLGNRKKMWGSVFMIIILGFNVGIMLSGALSLMTYPVNDIIILGYDFLSGIGP